MNTNDKIRDLAEQAWALSNNDFVGAVEILREWTGMSFDGAFAAIDAVTVIDEPECGEDEPL